MASASSPWPHASWNRTPPEPPARTIGQLAARRRTRLELRQGLARRLGRHRRHVVVLEHLEPRGLGDRLEARLHPRVAARHADHVHPRPDEVVASRTCRRSSRRGSGGASRRCPTITWLTADPVERAASSARSSSSTRRSFGTSPGSDVRAHVVGGERPERDGRRRALAGARDRRGGARRLEQAALGQVRRVREARRLARRRRGCPRRARGCCPSPRPCAGPSSCTSRSCPRRTARRTRRLGRAPRRGRGRRCRGRRAWRASCARA